MNKNFLRSFVLVGAAAACLAASVAGCGNKTDETMTAAPPAGANAKVPTPGPNPNGRVLSAEGAGGTGGAITAPATAGK